MFEIEWWWTTKGLPLVLSGIYLLIAALTLTGAFTFSEWVKKSYGQRASVVVILIIMAMISFAGVATDTSDHDYHEWNERTYR
ncbi:MAG: hypothetical protein K2X46_08110 [Roseomonas sp.]|nr:hypothetical protein [Roseomonas sp.]